MRRVLVIALALVASVAILVVGGAAGGDEGGYEVRAVFDNASFLVQGEDVRVGGAKIGSVKEVDIAGLDEVVREDGGTAPGKAIVVLQIDDPAFQDFRTDASCLIRPQSLIGEKFVECTPTEPRAPGTPAPPELEQIADGEPGEGQYLLPLERNGKAIDLDLVNNIMEEPYPDRFRLILNDLGAGLAARGDELAEIIERANPALRDTNRVLAILRGQNRALANLATDGAQIMNALARERESVAGFINASEVVGSATAERQAELEEGFAKLPGFLRELRSTMDELSRFSDAATPVFAELGAAAPSLTRLNRDTIPFSNAGTSAIVSLGKSAEVSGPALVASDPVIRQIRGLANNGVPATKNLAKLLKSLRKTGGFEHLFKTIFGLGGVVNGFDSYGHFLRALIPTNNCFDYTSIPQSGCSANFAATTASATQERERRRGDGRAERDQRDQQRAPETSGGDGDEPLETEPAPPAEPAEPDSDETAPGLETEPLVPDAAPDDTAPDGEPQVEAGSARALLDFLIGEPRRDRRGRR
jgi:ABC-type transporter Mla subunit MlaD